MGYLDKEKTDALNKAKRERGIGNLGSPKNPFDYYEREYGTMPRDTKRAPFQWVSEVAYKNVHRIVTRGYDTTELMEEGYGVIEVLFVDYQARIPTVEEGQMLNYVMIMALEDGISSPAAISRIVARSKTFLTQACGASIMAFGHAYGAYSAFGNRLEQYLKIAEEKGLSLEEAAKMLVEENLQDEALGVSDLMLKDPAAKRMIARAEKLGIAGKYIEFTRHVVQAAQKAADGPGGPGHAGCHRCHHDGSGIYPGGNLGHPGGYAFLCRRRPLHRRSGAGRLHPAGAAVDPQGRLRRPRGPAGAAP